MLNEYFSFGAKGIDSSFPTPPHERHFVILEPSERSDAHQKQALQTMKDAVVTAGLFPWYKLTSGDCRDNENQSILDQYNIM